MKFLNKGNGFFIMRDIVRLFFVINFFVFMIILGLNTEIESEYVVLLSIIIAGPFFCGWACPFGGLSYFMAKLGAYLFPSKQFLLPKTVDFKLRYLRYVFLIFFLYLFIVLEVDYFGEHFEMYMSTLPSKIFLITKYIAVILVSMFIPFFFCKYMCWQKVAYNIFCRVVGATKIKRDVASCVNCKKCEKACPMNLPISSSKTLSGVDCFSCFSCMKPNVCPKSHKSLTFCWLGNVVNIRYFSVAALLVYLITTLIVLRY